MKRYPDCQMDQSRCEACSLSSYGKDCCGAPANLLLYLRKQRGWTRAQAAKQTGVNQRQLQRIETGEADMGNVTLRNAIKIADAYGVNDLRDLIMRDDIDG